MLSTRDKVWNRNYRKLKAYIDEHHHLPDKKKVEHRGLLNWVKYNRKKIKAGTLSPEKMHLLCELLDSRSSNSPDTDAELFPASEIISRHAGLAPASHPAVTIVTDQELESVK